MIVPAGQTINIGAREYQSGAEIPDDIARAAGLNIEPAAAKKSVRQAPDATEANES
ncbi:MAG: hypothetical protein KKB59_10535 [Spirochaetes bacterium]|nr:hypothetical protein [Spirochaetota bacterium]